MSKKQILGLIGSVVLFVGVFTPLVSLPFVGNINYFMNGKGDGTIVLILAVISFLLVLAKKYNGLWLTGFASLGMMFFTFVNFQSKMSEAKIEMQKQLANNPFAGLGNLAIQSVQLQWGCAILIVGAVSVICAAAIKEQKESK